MNQDFRILDTVGKETNIERLKSIFVKFIHQNESKLVEITNAHDNEVTLLNQQISDSNAMINSLRIQIERQKNMFETEIDSIRKNEIFTHDANTKLESENSILKKNIEQTKIEFNEFRKKSEESVGSYLKELNNKNNDLSNTVLKLQAKNQILSSGLIQLKRSVTQLTKSIDQQKKGVSSIISFYKKLVQLSKNISSKACETSISLLKKNRLIHNGLKKIRKQVSSIRPITIDQKSFDIKWLRTIIETRIKQYYNSVHDEYDFHFKQQNINLSYLQQPFRWCLLQSE